MIQAERSFVKCTCGDWFTGISHFALWNHMFSSIIHNIMIQAKRSFMKCTCGDWFTGISHFELWNYVFSSIHVVKQ